MAKPRIKKHSGLAIFSRQLQAPAPTKRRRPRHPEAELQRSIIDYNRKCVPAGTCLVFAVPNGGARDGLEADLLKAEGVLAGVADLVLLLPGARTVFVEVKTEADKLRKISRGTQNADQVAFQANAEALGFTYRIVRSIEEWWALLVEFGVPVRARPFVAQSYQPVPLG